MDIESVEVFIRAAAELAGDGEVGQRVETVGSTAAKISSGQPIIALQCLRSLLDTGVVDRLTEWLGLSVARVGSQGASMKVATQLKRLVEDAELFRSQDDRPFARLFVGDHAETWPIDSNACMAPPSCHSVRGNAYRRLRRRPVRVLVSRRPGRRSASSLAYSMGRVGVEPTTFGLRARCSAS